MGITLSDGSVASHPITIHYGSFNLPISYFLYPVAFWNPIAIISREKKSQRVKFEDITPRK